MFESVFYEEWISILENYCGLKKIFYINFYSNQVYIIYIFIYISYRKFLFISIISFLFLFYKLFFQFYSHKNDICHNYQILRNY